MCWRVLFALILKRNTSNNSLVFKEAGLIEWKVDSMFHNGQVGGK